MHYFLKCILPVLNLIAKDKKTFCLWIVHDCALNHEVFKGHLQSSFTPKGGFKIFTCTELEDLTDCPTQSDPELKLRPSTDAGCSSVSIRRYGKLTFYIL